jgi:16S rRNA (uracil1498-N3)-methyltransferase
MDFVAVKATELCVCRLMAVFTRNTAVARVNVERLSANAREAAEQCGRLTVPEVAEAASLADFCAAWPEARRLYVAAREAPPIAEVLARDGALPGRPGRRIYTIGA